MAATIKLVTPAMDILTRCEVRDRYLYLPEGQMDRKLYEAVNKALVAMGGKWDRYVKAHVFESCPIDQLTWALTTGEVTDEKKALGFFSTPREIAEQMVGMAELGNDLRILEPSAGQGALIEALSRYIWLNKCAYCEIDFCEINAPRSLEILGRFDVHQSGFDFLAYNPGAVYDRILANPPFGMQQDVIHVMHMLDCLKPGGILVSVMSSGVTFRGNLKVLELKQRLEEHMTWDVKQLPKGAFKASGTDVNTVLLWAKKE